MIRNPQELRDTDQLQLWILIPLSRLIKIIKQLTTGFHHPQQQLISLNNRKHTWECSWTASWNRHKTLLNHININYLSYLHSMHLSLIANLINQVPSGMALTDSPQTIRKVRKVLLFILGLISTSLSSRVCCQILSKEKFHWLWLTHDPSFIES